MMSSLNVTNRRHLLAACVVALTLSGTPTRYTDRRRHGSINYREPAARLIGEAIGDTFAWRPPRGPDRFIGNR